MGYRAEKLKVEEKASNVKRVVLIVLVAIILALCIFSAFFPPSYWQYNVGCPDIEPRQAGTARVHFIDVGQGDCTLIELPDGRTMLIDGGNGMGETAKTILRYLNALDIDEIDYMVVTHADSDHCGSLDTVLEYKTVRTVFLPPVLAKYANEEYIEFYTKVSEMSIPTVFSSRQIVFNGDATYPYTLAFLHPYSLDVTEAAIQNAKSEDNNEKSAALWLDYAGASALFAGDLPMEIENKLALEDSLGAFKNFGVDLTSTEILKVSHHGSASSSSLDFLRYINVKTAVISCSAQNLYNHPSDEVLNALSTVNAGVYCTDEVGSVMITMYANGSYTTKCIP